VDTAICLKVGCCKEENVSEVPKEHFILILQQSPARVTCLDERVERRTLT